MHRFHSIDKNSKSVRKFSVRFFCGLLFSCVMSQLAAQDTDLGLVTAKDLPRRTLTAAPVALWDEARHITRSVLYGVGYTNLYDTYLSPLEYQGLELRISREAGRTVRRNPLLSTQSCFNGHLGFGTSPAGNNRMVSGMVNWTYAIHYRFQPAANFKILTGGAIDLNGGFFYNLRNGNNPASARVFANLDASVMGIWNFKIRRYPMQLRYQAQLPVVGARFSPHYGQSYYELFMLGNRSGMIRCTSLHNAFSLRQRLTLDFPVRRSTLRVSYVADLDQSHLNNLRTHSYSHCVLIGFVRDLYKLPTL